MITQHTRGRWTAFGVATALALSALGISASPEAAAAELPPAIAEYQFANEPADGVTVTNRATGSSFGPALVQNARAAQFADNSLVLGGGGKSTGPWVKLPSDLLSGKQAATVQAEVRADAAMMQKFHFLWNIGNDTDAEYFFTSLKCQDNRSPLVGLKTDASGESLLQAAEYGCGWKANEWLSVTAVAHPDQQGELYINGVLVASGSLKATPAGVDDQSLNTIGRSPWPDELFAGAVSTFRVYDEALTQEQIVQLSDEDAQLHRTSLQAQADSKLAAITIPSSVDGPYLPLPTQGGDVEWVSSHPDVLSAEGRVTQPPMGGDPVTVELVAKTSFRGFTATRTFATEVLPSNKTAEEQLNESLATYVIPPVMSTDDSLPAAPEGFTVAVEGDDQLTVEGDKVVITGEEAQGTLTATLTGAGQSVTKAFRVRVFDQNSVTDVLAYHRTPTSAQEANNGDIAYSMHLAKDVDGSWKPYNENYGIFFARSEQVPTNAVDVRLDIRSLRDPHVFRMQDGSFGIVAVRTNWGSAKAHPDDPAGTVLFATTKDFLTYEEAPNGQSLIALGEDNGVNDPYAIYDSAAQHYVVGWKDDSGVAKYTTFDELTSDAVNTGIRLGAVPLTGAVSADAAAIDDYEIGHAFPVENSLIKGMDTRFMPISNTSLAETEAITVEVGTMLSDLTLPEDVELGYSDGSTATKRIDDWDLSPLEPSLNTAGEKFVAPGSYTLTGTINKQDDYPLPFAEDRADPSVYKWEWKHDGVVETKFLMIATNDIDGDVVWQKGTPHMPIRMSDTIRGLADTPGDPAGLITPQGYNPKESILLRKGDTNTDGEAITGSFWAPELHEIGGHLSILFMPSYNNVWSDGSSAIMQLKKDANGDDLDPTKAENWTTPRTVLRADGKPLSIRQDGTVGMSLDMTYFQDDKGQSYYSWQQLGATYIATFDPTDPYTLTSDPVLIVSPEYAWDSTIAEGPNVLNRDGKLYLLYSGAPVGITYTTGLAVADASGDTDLLDPAAWTKLNYPIQNSSIFNGAWQLGTGHGMWSEDEHGELIYVFHAYAQETDGYSNRSGRDMFVRRVHWASDGLPVLDMGREQEVAPDAKATVTVNVVGEPSQKDCAPTAVTAGEKLVGKRTNVWGVAADCSGEAVVVELLQGSDWVAIAESTVTEAGTYVVALPDAVAAVGNYQLRVRVADGVSDVVALTRVAATTQTAASITLAGREANVWGTVDGSARVSTQVWISGRGWSTSQTREVTGGYVIPLTYGGDAVGTQQWRLLVQHDHGETEITPTFTQERVGRPSANSAGVTSVDRIANVWGTAQPGAVVWTEVQLPDGRWSKSQVTTANDRGGYVLELTYGRGAAGAYKFRVATRVAGLGTVYSDEFTLIRR